MRIYFIIFRKIFLFFLSCYTLQATAQLNGTAADYSFPFVLSSSNNIAVSAIINEQDTVQLMFHTSATDLTLTMEAVKRLHTLSFSRTDTVKSWGGSNQARFSGNNKLRIGNKRFNDIKIWENANSGPGTDGKFGLDLFAGKVIEINFETKVISITALLPARAATYTKVPVVFRDGMMFISAASTVGDYMLNHQFLIHSGYAGTVLFDDSFTKENHLSEKLKIISEKSLKDSYGNVLKIQRAEMPSFAIAGTTFETLPVGFFTGTIGRQQMSIIGGDLIKRFNIIIDAQRSCIYLQKNGYNKAPYPVD